MRTGIDVPHPRTMLQRNSMLPKGLIRSISAAHMESEEEEPPVIWQCFGTIVDDLDEIEDIPESLWVGYFESAYDLVDFLVTVITILDLVQRSGYDVYNSSINISALRALRLLRAFKHIPGLDQVPVIVRALVSGLKLLLNVMMILLFAYVVFTLVGINSLSNSLRRRCVDVRSIEPC